jgi:arylsulfatase A-like enzyme
MNKPTRAWVLVPILALGVLAACSRDRAGAESEHPRNVVIVVVDALRADHLGCYGYDHDTTPEIDRIAERGIVFSNAYSNATFTFPSTASLFTATLPVVHRITHDPKHQELIRRLSDEYVLLTEVFHDAGYRTGLLTFPGWVSPTANYMQGVDVRVESERSDTDLLARAREFISDSRDGRFFLYLHFIDMHDYWFPSHLFAGVDPYELGLSEDLVSLRGKERSKAYDALAYKLNEPGRLTSRDIEYLIEVYDRRLRGTDRVIGDLVRHLDDEGLLGDTLLVITSDHGEQFGEHNRLVHGADAFYNEVIHIPFIISNPRLFDGTTRASAPVTCIDFGPTLLDMVGLEVPSVFQGESLVNRLDEDRVVFACDGRTWKAINKEWSYILSEAKQREELYHLTTDPGETVNLVQENPDMALLGRGVIEDMRAACKKHAYLSIRIDQIEMSEEQRERLRSLGYID